MNRLKRIYTADVGKPLRWLTMLAMAVVALFMAASTVANVVLLCKGEQQYPLHIVFWVLVITISVTVTFSWMLIRLIRGVRANNGRTVMPEWFIRAFGILLLAYLLLIVITDQRPWRLIETAGVAAAMIGIRGLLRSTESTETETD